MKAFEYYAPAALEEAFDLLDRFEAEGKLLNGGTDVVIQLREKLIAPKAVIDIKRIPGLRGIAYDPEHGLTIGACVTMNELGNEALVCTHYPTLAKAALSVGSKQVRNRATCAGNLINASPLADTATPLLAYGASVVAVSREGEREIPLDEFFVFVRKTSLRPGEIVTAVRVPAIPSANGVFTKISRRREVDLSTLCATVLKTGEGWRVAYGSVAPTPIRLRQTEALLDAQPLTEERITRAVELARSEISPISDVRASQEYRLEVAGVVLERSLRALM